MVAGSSPWLELLSRVRRALWLDALIAGTVWAAAAMALTTLIAGVANQWLIAVPGQAFAALCALIGAGAVTTIVFRNRLGIDAAAEFADRRLGSHDLFVTVCDLKRTRSTNSDSLPGAVDIVVVQANRRARTAPRRGWCVGRRHMGPMVAAVAMGTTGLLLFLSPTRIETPTAVSQAGISAVDSAKLDGLPDASAAPRPMPMLQLQRDLVALMTDGANPRAVNHEPISGSSGRAAIPFPNDGGDAANMVETPSIDGPSPAASGAPSDATPMDTRDGESDGASTSGKHSETAGVRPKEPAGRPDSSDAAGDEVGAIETSKELDRALSEARIFEIARTGGEGSGTREVALGTSQTDRSAVGTPSALRDPPGSRGDALHARQLDWSPALARYAAAYFDKRRTSAGKRTPE